MYSLVSSLCVCSVAQSCPNLCYPMDCSLPGSLSMEFSRQEHWSGLPSTSPGDLPDPGIKPVSLALAGRLSTTARPARPRCVCVLLSCVLYFKCSPRL